MKKPFALLLLFSVVWPVILLCMPAHASIFGNVRGIVHDPQHLAIADAQVEIHAKASDWSQTTTSNAEGQFEFDAVPIGDYVVTVKAEGFAALEQPIQVNSESAPILHFQLAVQAVSQSVEVTATPEIVNPQSSTTETTISRSDITESPGAARTDSLTMITNTVPGAYMVHDQLHVRGGHQVTWQIDGVPVPNTNIASNVGPQFDPKDIDVLEVQRGGYSAEYGDRTYGVFNVVPRTGFEGTNFGQIMTGFGSFNRANAYLDFGSHTDRFAYYGSLNGYRTDLGLETVVPQALHDAANGYGGFTSILFNPTAHDQLRFVSSIRQDHFQVPNNQDQQAAGISDVENEDDALANFTWLHTSSPGVLWTISPYYHFNRAHYIGGSNDTPLIPEDDRGSQYVGGHISLSITKQKHSASFGWDAFGQRDNSLFGITANDGSGSSLRQQQTDWANVQALFLQEQYRMLPWLTLNGGLRYTHYSGLLSEDATSPRVGAAIQVPRVGWTLRGFYGRYYQAPPLSTVSGPLLAFALDQGFGFLPLKGERDEQWEVGLAIPMRGWSLDMDYFHTRARNFFDHDALGNSNIFFPLTIDTARIHGWESTLRSPAFFHRVVWHYAFSDQTVQGRGAVSGGLTDFSPPNEGFFYLDHDQRVTFNTGWEAKLPWATTASASVEYGSGFLNGDGPDHLPGHTTLDLSFEKQVGENWSLELSALNVGNRRYMLDSSNTFGGTHFANPREISGQVSYRFHY
jgi:outer membrane receptor protein involved in Fe transport